MMDKPIEVINNLRRKNALLHKQIEESHISEKRLRAQIRELQKALAESDVIIEKISSSAEKSEEANHRKALAFKRFVEEGGNQFLNIKKQLEKDGCLIQSLNKEAEAYKNIVENQRKKIAFLTIFVKRMKVNMKRKADMPKADKVKRGVPEEIHSATKKQLENANRLLRDVHHEIENKKEEESRKIKEKDATIKRLRYELASVNENIKKISNKALIAENRLKEDMNRIKYSEVMSADKFNKERGRDIELIKSLNREVETHRKKAFQQQKIIENLLTRISSKPKVDNSRILIKKIVDESKKAMNKMLKESQKERKALNACNENLLLRIKKLLQTQKKLQESVAKLSLNNHSILRREEVLKQKLSKLAKEYDKQKKMFEFSASAIRKYQAKIKILEEMNKKVVESRNRAVQKIKEIEASIKRANQKRMDRDVIKERTVIRKAGEKQDPLISNEIKAMIKIALQHGDNMENIRKSLINSGYNKREIEPAIKKISLKNHR